MYDEAWFYLTGYVNSQTNLCRTAEKLDTIKNMEYAASSCYISLILKPLIQQLHDDEMTHEYFQQDNANDHKV
jgi:hypothetical protein